MKHTILLLIVLLTISCNKKPRLDIKSDEVHPVNITKSNVLLDAERFRQLKIEAFNGDSIAYNELSGSYADMGFYDEFLFVSMTVANRYKNSQAMLDVYESLSCAPPQVDPSVYEVDSITQSLALFYLLKSYESGNSLAKFRVESVFESQKVPSSTFYLDDYKARLELRN